MARQWDPASLSALGGAFKGMREGLITGSALATEAQQRKQRALEIDAAERQAEYQKTYAALPVEPEAGTSYTQASDVSNQQAGQKFGGSGPAAQTGKATSYEDIKEWEDNRIAVAQMAGPEAVALEKANIESFKHMQMQKMVGAASVAIATNNGYEAYNIGRELAKFDPLWERLMSATFISPDGKGLMIEGEDGKPVLLGADTIWGFYETMNDPLKFELTKSEIEKNLAGADAAQAQAQAALDRAAATEARAEAAMLAAEAKAAKNLAPLTAKEAQAEIEWLVETYGENGALNTRFAEMFSKDDTMHGWVMSKFMDDKYAANVTGRVFGTAKEILITQGDLTQVNEAVEVAARLAAWSEGMDSETPEYTYDETNRMYVVRYPGYPPVSLRPHRFEAFLNRRKSAEATTEPTTEPTSEPATPEEEQQPAAIPVPGSGGRNRAAGPAITSTELANKMGLNAGPPSGTRKSRRDSRG